MFQKHAKKGLFFEVFNTPFMTIQKSVSGLVPRPIVLKTNEFQLLIQTESKTLLPNSQLSTILTRSRFNQRVKVTASNLLSLDTPAERSVAINGTGKTQLFADFKGFSDLVGL
jgi:hypothetical protein